MMIGWLESEGVPKSGTRQMPCLRRFCQSVPSWISPRTPMESIMRPFSAGRDGSTSGMIGVGIGDGSGVGIGAIDGSLMVS